MFDGYCHRAYKLVEEVITQVNRNRNYSSLTKERL